MDVRATILSGLTGLAMVSGCVAYATNPVEQQTDAETVWLDRHNAARAEFGSEPLRWNPDLARQALGWAERLARENRLRHSPREARGRTGENLWMGTAGRFAPQRMIDAFVSEKQYFQAGTFPNVSRTGNTGDVGHYTQIVWADTREVGCATARGTRFDVLVCRYWPAGNVIGQTIAPQPRITFNQVGN